MHLQSSLWVSKFQCHWMWWFVIVLSCYYQFGYVYTNFWSHTSSERSDLLPLQKSVSYLLGHIIISLLLLWAIIIVYFVGHYSVYKNIMIFLPKIPVSSLVYCSYDMESTLSIICFYYIVLKKNKILESRHCISHYIEIKSTLLYLMKTQKLLYINVFSE